MRVNKLCETTAAALNRQLSLIRDLQWISEFMERLGRSWKNVVWLNFPTLLNNEYIDDVATSAVFEM